MGMFVWSRVAESLSVSLSAVSVFVSVSLVSSRTHNVHSRGTVVLKKRSFCAAIAVASPLFLSIVGLLAVLFAVPRSLAPLPTFWPLLVSCVVSSAIAHETTLSTPVVSVYSLALPTCTSGFGWGCVFRSVECSLVRWCPISFHCSFRSSMCFYRFDVCTGPAAGRRALQLCSCAPPLLCCCFHEACSTAPPPTHTPGQLLACKLHPKYIVVRSLHCIASYRVVGFFFLLLQNEQ